MYTECPIFIRKIPGAQNAILGKEKLAQVKIRVLTVTQTLFVEAVQLIEEPNLKTQKEKIAELLFR